MTDKSSLRSMLLATRSRVSHFVVSFTFATSSLESVSPSAGLETVSDAESFTVFLGSVALML